MQEENVLEELGLTKNEAKVYLALIDIGITTTSALIKRTGINTSKVYESLERLLKKGLVSYAIIKNKKHWQAENPNRIKAFLEEETKKIEQKKADAEKLISGLLVKRNLKETETTYKVYEGIKGIKTAREHVLDVLNKGDTFYIILSNYPNDEKLEAYWMDFQERRAKKGIKCKYILNEDLRKIGEKRKKLPFSETRFVNPEGLSPTWTEIYKDHVTIGVLSSKPSVFVIKNPDIAKGFINYFEFLWKTGKP
ncbi:MAG TPA: helix-turn-helix domain-containing protein [Candidatus Nanoarchaeia archaeon]|nr:helix-turn-helix domain-containing protein [Candidatus Nanoarchaeia archaeon]